MQSKRLLRVVFLILGVLLTMCRVFRLQNGSFASNSSVGIYQQVLTNPQPETYTTRSNPTTEIIPTWTAVPTLIHVDILPATLDALRGIIKAGVPLNLPRAHHTATLLQNGMILLAGGSVEPDDFAMDEELIDPVTGSSRWTAPLHTARHDHTATLLPDGRVLIVGGYNLPHQWLSDAEIYDPLSDTWTVISPLFPHGTVHTATRMKDGRVLVVGGCIGSGICTEKAEIFDPNTNSWIEATPLKENRGLHTAQLLDDGQVLIAGGYTDRNEIPVDGSAVLYNPQTNTWNATMPMAFPLFGSEAVKLPNGSVLVAGGVFIQTDPPVVSNAVEIYEPGTNSWYPVAPLAGPRYAFILSILPDGRVIAIGGTRDWDCCWTQSSFVREIEVFDPATEQWEIIGDLPQPTVFSASERLGNGQIWIAGGQMENWVLNSTWLIGP